jgi:HAD superfamily hydrolase (TIGR01549 family)
MNNWIIGTTGPDRILSCLTDKTSDGQERIICFDYFDTVVTRTVYPEFTKQLAARLLSLAGGELLGADELYETRSGLERRMCEQSAAEGGELEFYLHQLAPEYLRILREREPEFLTGWSDDDFSRLMLDIELSVETNVQQPCTEVIDVLKSIRERGLKTALISDFFLPSPYFGRMLTARGLDDLFDYVYVSADHGLAKGSGRLYAKVCEDLGCDTGQLIMIGDNRHADIDMARQQGIETIHVENPAQQNYYKGWRQPGQDDHEFLEAIAAARTQPFKELAFSLWLFMLRLFGRLAGNHARHVFFFSKEGEFLKNSSIVSRRICSAAGRSPATTCWYRARRLFWPR